MICLRCGYCCHRYPVMIVDDPDNPISEDNIVAHKGNGPCKHLEGDKRGKYSCKVHSKSWYKETPCFSYGQVEGSIDSECRLGRYFMDNSDVIFER